MSNTPELLSSNDIFVDTVMREWNCELPSSDLSPLQKSVIMKDMIKNKVFFENVIVQYVECNSQHFNVKSKDLSDEWKFQGVSVGFLAFVKHIIKMGMLTGSWDENELNPITISTKIMMDEFGKPNSFSKKLIKKTLKKCK